MFFVLSSGVLCKKGYFANLQFLRGAFRCRGWKGMYEVPKERMYVWMFLYVRRATHISACMELITRTYIFMGAYRSTVCLTEGIGDVLLTEPLRCLARDRSFCVHQHRQIVQFVNTYGVRKWKGHERKSLFRKCFN